MSKFSEAMNEELDFLEASDNLVIDTNRLAQELYDSSSMDHMTLGDLRMAYTKSRIAVAMYIRGYRSVIHGAGYYVKPNETDKKEYIEKIYNNAQLSKAQKEHAIQLIKKSITTNKNIDPNQLEFDMEGNITLSKTDEQLLEMLANEAKEA